MLRGQAGTVGLSLAIQTLYPRHGQHEVGISYTNVLHSRSEKDKEQILNDSLRRVCPRKRLQAFPRQSKTYNSILEV